MEGSHSRWLLCPALAILTSKRGGELPFYTHGSSPPTSVFPSHTASRCALSKGSVACRNPLDASKKARRDMSAATALPSKLPLSFPGPATLAPPSCNTHLERLLTGSRRSRCPSRSLRAPRWRGPRLQTVNGHTPTATAARGSKASRRIPSSLHPRGAWGGPREKPQLYVQCKDTFKTVIYCGLEICILIRGLKR